MEDETTDHSPLPDTEGSRERMLRDSGKESGQGILGLSVMGRRKNQMSRLGRGRRCGQDTGHLIAWLSWRTGRDGRAWRRHMDGKLPGKGHEVHSRRGGKNTERSMSTSHHQTGHDSGLDRGKTAALGAPFSLPQLLFFFHTFYLFLNILFHTGVALIYNVGLVSGVQQTDSATKNSHTLVFTVVLFTIVKT